MRVYIWCDGTAMPNGPTEIAGGVVPRLEHGAE